MSSSDSDEDYYGNITQKLQKIKNKYEETDKENAVLIKTSEVCKVDETTSKQDANASGTVVEDFNITLNNSTDNDEYSLDAIIASNTKVLNKKTRGGKRKASDSNSDTSERVTRSSKRKTANSTRGRSSPVSEEPTDVLPDVTVDQSSASISRGRGRGRGNRGRNRGASSSQSPVPRGRGGRRRAQQLLTHLMNCLVQNNFNTNQNYPTYSVGNTEEYPDQSDNQELFSTRPVNNEVEVIEESNPLEDDNEELSVKVYWQSLEIFKFKIRKYQKITQIFDYFANKEGVSHDKLLFTYNDRILKSDDTPDSIDYSIAKFIDGGIVNQNVTELVKQNGTKNEIVNGLKLKFQCQNLKKPFEITLRPHDKLLLAMMKCAEHLETPLEKLKFYFDGDLLSSKNTPQDLELEGGECIDVKIIS